MTLITDLLRSGAGLVPALPARPAPVDPRLSPSLGALLDEAGLQFASEPAVARGDAETGWHQSLYSELRLRAYGLARLLEDAGVGPDDRVVTALADAAELGAAAWAVWLRGAVLVPLDAAGSAEALAELAAHARPRALIADAGAWRRLALALGDARPERVWTVGPEAEVGSAGVAPWGPVAGEPAQGEIARERDDLAVIAYAPHSSGRPAGAQLTHGALLGLTAALVERTALNCGSRAWSVLSPHDPLGLAAGLLAPWCAGATVVGGGPGDASTLVATLRSAQVTHLAGPAAVLEPLEAALDAQRDASAPWQRRAQAALTALHGLWASSGAAPDLSHRLLGPKRDAVGGALRVVLCDSAALDRVRAERLHAAGVAVLSGLGLGPACPLATLRAVAPYQTDSVGAPIAGITLRVGARSDGADPGPVAVAGRGVMRGYFEAPELTAAALADGWLDAGVEGRLDAAGRLHLAAPARPAAAADGTTDTP